MDVAATENTGGGEFMAKSAVIPGKRIYSRRRVAKDLRAP
jgi:hypothetical protein